MCSPLVHSCEAARHENGRDAGDSSRLAPDTSWLAVVEKGLEGLQSWALLVSKQAHEQTATTTSILHTNERGTASLPLLPDRRWSWRCENITLGCMHVQYVKSTNTSLYQGEYESCKSTHRWSKLVAIDFSSSISSLTSINKHCG